MNAPQAEKQAWIQAIQLGRTIKTEREAIAPLVRLLGQHGDAPHALEHPTLRIDDVYIMGEILGVGQVGKVYRAKHRGTGTCLPQGVISYADSVALRRRRARRDKTHRQVEICSSVELASPRSYAGNCRADEVSEN